jgi:hypothetical protein
MSIAQSDYANTDAEFERILTASLNDCVIPKQDINHILLTKSVYLYLSNLLKKIIIQQSIITNGMAYKCISCYTESHNVYNICKCGLENLCYSCMLTKYVPVLTDKVKENKDTAITNNIFNKNWMVTLLQNTVFCKYCNVTGCMHNALNILNNDNPIGSENTHIIHETDFLNMESKTMVDIFPNMNMSGFIQQKNMDALTNYGFELEHNHDTQTIIFKLNSELLNMITDTSRHLNIHTNTDSVRCDTNIITPAIFNVIYYKCVDFGLKNKVIDKTLIFNWNKFCQKMNKLLNLYSNNNANCQINYYMSVVLINEIKNMAE